MGKPRKNALAKTEAGLKDLIGEVILVKIPGKEDLIVPMDKSANRIANMIMASKIRWMIESSIKTYTDKDMLPSTQDLKNLAAAAKDVHAFSGEVYKDEDGGIKAPQPVQPAEGGKDEDTDFNVIDITPPPAPTPEPAK